MKRTMGILFADNDDSHLKELTLNRTSASVPFGGRYRLIDFELSNFANANVTKIGILTRNNYNSLMDHIRMGRDWDLNRKNSGLSIYPPFVFNTSHDVYKGKVEALYTLKGFISKSEEEYVLISDTDIAINIDFDDVEKFHLSKGADITMLTYKTDEFTAKKIILKEDKNKRIVDMRLPVSTDTSKQLCDLNIYFLKKSLLLSLIDKAYAYGEYNFEKDVVHKNLEELYVMSYEVKDYVAVIDSVESYFKHSMDLLDLDTRESLFYKNSTIYTKVKDSVPTRYKEGANVKNSIIADGCEIDGTVENSILFRSVKVGKGAVIKNSIIMEKSIIMDEAKLDYTITDKNVIIEKGRQLSGYATYPIVIAKSKRI